MSHTITQVHVERHMKFKIYFPHKNGLKKTLATNPFNQGMPNPTQVRATDETKPNPAAGYAMPPILAPTWLKVRPGTQRTCQHVSLEVKIYLST